MRILQTFVVVPLVIGLVMPSSVMAQDRHVVDPAALAAAVANQASAEADQRQVVLNAIARPEAVEAMARLGVDADRVASAVNLLSGPDLERAATAARQLEDPLVGGQNGGVWLSTTMIIVILLVVIVIVAVAD